MVISPLTSVGRKAMQSLSRSVVRAVPAVSAASLADTVSYLETELQVGFTVCERSQNLTTRTISFRPVTAFTTTAAANHVWKPLTGADPPLPARNLRLT